MHRILFLANRTCECPTVINEVEQRARSLDAEVLLVAPAVNTRVRHFVSDTDGAVRDATARVDVVTKELAGRGIVVSGQVGDADPVAAAADALRSFPADEVIVATHPPEHSHWLEKNLIERLAGRFELPVTHLISYSGVGEAAAAA